MFYAAILIILCVFVWASIINVRTYYERMALIPEIRDPEFYPKIARLARMSYLKHFWLRFFLMKPQY